MMTVSHRLFFSCWILFSVILQENSAEKTEECPSNEVPVKCTDRCKACEYRNGNCSQIQVCEPGCDCRNGFYRHKIGMCVPERLCNARRCRRNERFYKNKPDCKNTCENYNNPEVRCPIGKRGCFCREGLVKRKDGRCVPPKYCFPQTTCGPNSIPSDCASLCPPTCSNRNPICAQVCVNGCVCVSGFIQDDSGKCVSEKLCPVVCGPNSEPSNCASPCPPTCSNAHPACAEVCIKDCVCDLGFIKDDFGNCIPKDMCPVVPLVCGPNSKPSDCASPCPPTCSNAHPACAEVCVIDCVCDLGYIKDNFGNCIPKDMCPVFPIVCGPNSKPNDCASPCPPTCSNAHPACAAVCVKDCVCDLGYIKDDFGSCIPKDMCPVFPMVCGPNSKPNNCASPCPPTCNNRSPRCAEVCVEGCVCDLGFLKDDLGICILEALCPFAESISWSKY